MFGVGADAQRGLFERLRSATGKLVPGCGCTAPSRKETSSFGCGVLTLRTVVKLIGQLQQRGIAARTQIGNESLSAACVTTGLFPARIYAGRHFARRASKSASRVLKRAIFHYAVAFAKRVDWDPAKPQRASSSSPF